ncbi:MAG TPA: cupin domain-containing protein [Gemmatimonadales bacterium]
MEGNILRIGDQARFDPARYTKAELVRGAGLFLGLNCFEPGQAQAAHTHANSEKFYLVLEGKARMRIGDTTPVAVAGDLIWAPAGVVHGIEEALERTVLLVGMTPPPA